jgi:hypothetical protein
MDHESLSLSQFNFNFNFVSLMKTVAKPSNLENGGSLLIIFILNTLLKNVVISNGLLRCK